MGPTELVRGAKWVWDVLREAVISFARGEALTQGAALAYYGTLSLAPVVMLLVSFAGLAGPATQDAVVRQIESLLGSRAATAIEMVMESARTQGEKAAPVAAAGLLVLVIMASGLLAQLQTAMNAAWRVQAEPGLGMRGLVKKRLVSIALVVVVLFSVVISIAVSSAVALLAQGREAMAHWMGLLLSIVTSVALFAVLLEFLPDVKVRWRDAWIGAAVTSVLHGVGKLAIGLYIEKAGVGSAYGAAGALVVLISWLYWSSLIVLFGVEVTRAVSIARGMRVVPELFAVAAGAKGASTKAS